MDRPVLSVSVGVAGRIEADYKVRSMIKRLQPNISSPMLVKNVPCNEGIRVGSYFY